MNQELIQAVMCLDFRMRCYPPQNIHITITETIYEAIWLNMLLTKLSISSSTVVPFVNQYAIHFSRDQMCDESVQRIDQLQIIRVMECSNHLIKHIEYHLIKVMIYFMNLGVCLISP